MISQSQNTALLTVGNAAAAVPEWREYAEYCFCREKGLRKKAFVHLETFLRHAVQWPFAARQRFVRFLMRQCETVRDADYGPFPAPLRKKLAEPLLLAWCARETTNSDPFRWYGRYFQNREHLERAVAINPRDDAAREILLDWRIDALYFATHHLPDYYIGDADEHMALAAEIARDIALLGTPEKRETWTRELEEYASLIRNYLEWRQSGHPDLAKWSETNDKNVSSGVTAYYYKQ